MKKYSLYFIAVLFFYSSFCLAQPGYISTIAGNGTHGFSGDGGPATSAQMGQTLGIFADAMGNVYIQDDDNDRLRRVDAMTGIITTIAGGGTSMADGIPATNANIGFHGDGEMAADAAGNIYFADDHRIRKISSATGIITTVAGMISSGYSGDGGPATAAKLNSPVGLWLDGAGNMFIGDEDNYRIRKVNSAGIISTIAGTGIAGFSGDGGPATAAQLKSPDGLCMDASGNLYVSDRYNYRIRKIDPSGTISTISGIGSGFAGDSGPASAARFSEPSHLCMDSYGELYIADFHNGRIRKINSSGIINTYAGGGSSLASGIPATSASFGDTWGIAMDGSNNLYIADRSHNRVRKVNGIAGSAASPSDSFRVYINKLCNGPELITVPYHYTPGMTVSTDFGDGTSELTSLLPGYLTGGYARITHTYSVSGTFGITQVLYNGTVPLDTQTNAYTYSFCRSFPIRMFYDANTNTVKDSAEAFGIRPTITEVSANGIPVDTFSATSGFDYGAYGIPGDIYSFRLLSPPGDMIITAPSSGIIFDTVQTAVTTNSPKFFGLACASSFSFDLTANAVIPVTGVRDQWGNIYVRNNSCVPTNADVTINFSPKYVYTGGARPAPTSTTATSITWHLTGLSGDATTPVNLYYAIWNNPATGLVPIRDTVRSIVTVTPIGGDSNPIDNYENHLDTVRAGCDPNEVFVSPVGCIASGAAANQLEYTIHFENYGNDTAHDIYVMDTLSDFVDPASVTIVNSSAEMYVSALRYGSGHNVLRFDFPHINLLDSSHHNESNGSVIFTINTRPGLAIGTTIPNHAGIFFDYNEVVMTNTVGNTIGCPPVNVAVIDKHDVQIYPNPATDELTIKTERGAYQSFTISNSLGQQFIEQQFDAAMTAVNIKTLPAGLYYISLRGESGVKTEKFVKR
jgi:uncharacterized repeat protein (TIGR01451 family)